MCTLSWIRGVDRYSVFMNRDEQPTRAPGIPPTIHEGRVRWIAPIDGQSHGTWIGATDQGVTLAILAIVLGVVYYWVTSRRQAAAVRQ